MLSWIKKILITTYLGNPFFRKGVSLGKGSFIRERAQIRGGKYINIGSHSRISPYSRLMCFELISGQRLKPKMTIGDNCFIGRNCNIACSNEVEIGNDCLIAGYVFIYDSEHGMNPEFGASYEKQPLIRKSTKIGNNVFIGEKAMIMPGTRIGDNCIIGAGSVVKDSFGDNCMVVGKPAKCVKNTTIQLMNGRKWSINKEALKLTISIFYRTIYRLSAGGWI